MAFSGIVAVGSAVGSAVGPIFRAGGRLILSVALTFLGLTLVTFVIGRVIPIDPVIAIVGDHAPPGVYETFAVLLRGFAAKPPRSVTRTVAL